MVDWLSEIETICGQMHNTLQTPEGGFKENRRDTARKGPFTTIEGLYPLLLYPKSEKFYTPIVKGIDYLLGEAENNGWKISPHPYFPEIDHSIDSTAYGLYVLLLARNFFNKNNKGSQDHKQRLENINKLIIESIKYISEYKNDDNGWGLRHNLKSRTYSTCLVIYALSNCSKNDFLKVDIDGDCLIADGVKFLQNNNKNENEPGWYYSEPEEFDSEEITNKKTTKSVNLTATVVFSLSHLWFTSYRNNENPKDIHNLILQGRNYIINSEKFQSLNEDNTNYDYIFTSDREIVSYNDGNISTNFDHPPEMIIPALILAPGYSIKNQPLIKYRDYLCRKINETVNNIGNRRWNLFEFSDKVFALIYHHYVENAFTKCLNLFVKEGDVFRCLIDEENKCYNVKEALKRCPHYENEESCEYIIEANNKCPFDGDIKSCIHIKNRNRFKKFFEWVRKKPKLAIIIATLSTCAILYPITYTLSIYFYNKINLDFISIIYGIVLGILGMFFGYNLLKSNNGD